MIIALRTVSNTGGNWNAVGTWVGGVVPIAGDTVAFTATSGPLLVNVSTAVLAGINFTNYVNTITFNQPINTNGTINLNTGGYTQAGASGLIISGTATISGSATWSRTLTFTGTTYTITLGSTINVTGQVTFSQTGTLSFSVGANTFNPTGDILVAHGITTLPNNLNIVNLSIIPSTTTQPTLNTNTINISGNLTLNSSTSGMFVSGTTSLILTGTGTWSHSGTAMQLRNNLTINTAGTLTVSGNVYYNTGTLTYTSGTVTTTGSTLNINAATTLNTSTVSWNNVTISIITNIATTTITLSSNFNVTGVFTLTMTAFVTIVAALTFSGVGTLNPTGALTINAAQNLGFTVTLPNSITITNLTLTPTGGINSNITINGNTINATGNLALTGTSSIAISGTTNINLTGTGTWSNTVASSLRNNLTINTAGIITISGNVYYNTGILTYTAGTVTTTGSTLNITTSTTLNTDRGATKITWVNITISAGTQTLTSNLNVGGNLTLTGTIAGAFTVTVIGTLTTGVSVINVTSTTVSGGLAINGATSGTSPITLNGNGTWSSTGFYLSNNLTINTAGTITIGTNVYYNTGTLTYTTGTVTTTSSTLNIGSTTTLNTVGITWDNVTIITAINAATIIITLSSNLNISGAFVLTMNTVAIVAVALSFSGVGTLNPSSSLTINAAQNLGFTVTLPNSITITNLTLNQTGGVNANITLNSNTINATGNLSITGSITVIISGTTNINLTGTGTWSNSVATTLRNNLTINTSGTITISGNIYYNTGTITYTAGTVTTTGSTLNITGATTLNTSGMTWNNITFGATQTITSNLNVGGNLTTQTTSVVINGLFNVNVSGSLAINITTSGTSTIVLNGTGTWSHGSAVYLSNNLIINTAGTITIGTNVYYSTGTLTYTAGTVNTTTNNSTLTIAASTTLNVDGITWYNVAITTGTLTLTSNFVISNNLIVGTTNAQTISFSGVGLLSPTITCNLVVPINSTNTTLNLPYNITVNNFTYSVSSSTLFVLNNYTINILGNLSLIQTASNAGYIIYGTGSLAMIGTGTWSSTYQPFQSSGTWYNYISLNITFDTTGVITITNSVAIGFRNDGIATTKTITYISGTVDATSSILWVIDSAISSGIVFNTNTLMWGNIYNPRQSSASNNVNTITLLSDLNISGTLYFFDGNFSNSLGFAINGIYSINIASLVVSPGGGVLTGTATFVFNKTGSWIHGIGISVSNNIIINTSGTLTISGNVYYNSRTITYTNGKVITTGSTLNLTAACTLINCHKINFNRVTITSGVNITMNEFFSGSPGLKTTITPSSTTNYTITFQDGFEKFSKFVKVSRATVSTPGQLTVITDKGNQLNNVGIKFAPNQITNGLPKNTPSTSTTSPYGLQPSYLVTDPTLS